MTQGPTHPDPQQENRRLRAAMEQMRSRQRLARGGVLVAVFLFIAGKQVAPQVSLAQGGMLEIVLGVIGLVVIVVTAIPFLRSQCPKCGQAYHSVTALFVSAEDPAPCKHCGFEINRHVSRYS
jgi:hypothetical protein